MKYGKFLALFLSSAAAALAWSASALPAELVSKALDGTPGNGNSFFPSMSADGRFVAFHSAATNLGPTDTNNHYDIYVKDRQSGAVELISVSSTGEQGNGNSLAPKISADGRYIVFHSIASNLVSNDTNGAWDVFIHDRNDGSTRRISVSSAQVQAADSSFVCDISGNGNFATFNSNATNLVPNDTGQSDGFVRDLGLGTTERITVDSAGNQQKFGDGGCPASDYAGRFMVFSSSASSLGSGTDTNYIFDAFIHDRITGITERLSNDSLGNAANGPSWAAGISNSGNFVSITTFAGNLGGASVPGIYFYDRSSGIFDLVTLTSSGNPASTFTYGGSMTDDGRYVVFDATGTNVTPDDNRFWSDIFLRDRVAGTTQLISAAPAGGSGDHWSYAPSINPDGKLVAFHSAASNLVEGQSISYNQVYVAQLGSTNQPPTADAGGPYSVNEGGSVALAGSGSDPDNDPLTFEWDLDNNGSFETSGQTPLFSLTDDGPAIKTVKLRVSDPDGAISTAEAQVTVLNVAPDAGAITGLPLDPIPVNTALTPSAAFTDPGVLDTHTGEWNWDDGPTSAATVAESGGNGQISGSHTYTAPGVYTVSCTVTDKDGDSGACDPFDFLVVYDPDGGFVTGGGMIDSPAGALVADPTATGKAHFAFHAKYQKGANVPSGSTEFQFQAGDLRLHSSTYQWLVVSGARAQFKGTAEVNGAPGFGFLLTAIDGAVNGGGGVDKFRIKIWEIDSGMLVYDNEMGTSDGGDPSTAVTNGSIVIHG